jgi:Tfp pilus assembly protein PilX
MCNNTNKQKGVSLIITFFIMIIIIAIVLSISTLLYSEIKIIRNMSGSVTGFYAADGGVEKVLYYDRKVIPSGSRGLCSMCAATGRTCPESGPEASLNCTSCVMNPASSSGSCTASNCKLCTVTFTTTFDGMTYTISATSGTQDAYMLAKSIGTYNYSSRALNVLSGTNDIFN